MPTVLRYKGSRPQLLKELKALPRVFAGKEPDRGAAVESVMLAGGLTLLGRVQDAYEIKSAGGIGDDGIQWAPLSPVTLALRRKGPGGAKAIVRLGKSFKNAPLARQKLIRRNYQRLRDLYESDMSVRGHPGAQSKRVAIRILKLTKPYITPDHFKKTLAELNRSDFLKTIRGKTRLKTAKQMVQDRAAIKRTSFVAAFALILRDTGILLGSLSPDVRSSDMINKFEPGALTIGSNVEYMKYHQSSAPRKLKADGTPRLPRRQILPDDDKPIPPTWWVAVVGTIRQAMAQPQFWTAYLGGHVQ